MRTLVFLRSKEATEKAKVEGIPAGYYSCYQWNADTISLHLEEDAETPFTSFYTKEELEDAILDLSGIY